MARERGGDPSQVDRPDSTSTLSHATQGDPNGPQSAQASDRAAHTALTGHPDEEIQKGQHQAPIAPGEAKDIVDAEIAAQDPGREDTPTEEDREADPEKRNRDRADNESADENPDTQLKYKRNAPEGTDSGQQDDRDEIERRRSAR
jgi:hypothetical protein